ncbi:hypothetical protein BYT27DRAFT_7217863 [Phlegmacium glaucopus]|nr:hypothetical protein BYT27DRAFT_7217863 [Phlegmacium glaucopus]
MRFTTALFVLTVTLTSVNADIVGFSGNDCTGAEGANVPCDNSCHQFGGRNSFQVLASDTACSEDVGLISNDGSGSCSNVFEPGFTVQSFTFIIIGFSYMIKFGLEGQNLKEPT